MSYSRREILSKGAGLAGILYGLNGCKTITPALQKSADFAGKTYEEFIGRFMDSTSARYVATDTGATVTYDAPDGSQMKIIDGAPKGLSLIEKAREGFKSLFGSDDAIQYDGKTPDKVIVNSNGVVSTYDRNTDVTALSDAAKSLKQITAEVIGYLKLFAAAIDHGDVMYEEPKKYNDRSVLADLGRTKITARASIDVQSTDYFKVERDGRLVAEITGALEIFALLMQPLVSKARSKLGNKAAKDIADQLN